MNNNVIVSFNCKGLKRSIEDVRQLCKSSDLIALQETWLLPHDISLLSNIDEKFGYTGTSAVDTTTGLLHGRPYGGVALLWNKSVFANVSVVKCDNPRVCAIKITLGSRSFLVFSVYMPTDKVINLPEFTDCLSSVSAIVNNENVESVFILGDFNAHPNEDFYNELTCFCKESEWTCADVQFLGIMSNTYSFVSEAHGSRRWLDHCITTDSALLTILNIYIKYDIFWSDHYPLILECNFDLIKQKIICNKKSNINKVLWGDRKPVQIDFYSKLCHERLSRTELTNNNFCFNNICNNTSHKTHIDKLYNSIVDILTGAATASYRMDWQIDRRPVVGWNRYVHDAHRKARSAFLLWTWSGKPISGHVYDEMHKSRNIFKSRLKWCQNNSEQIRMDILASHHSKHDFKSFWKATNKSNCRPGLPVSIEGISDCNLIAELFKDHFSVKSPLGPSKSEEEDRASGYESSVIFTANDIKKIIISMSHGRSPGHDGLSIEHLKHAGALLPTVLAVFYNQCVGHSYLPTALMKTLVVPIVNPTNQLPADISCHHNC